MERHIVEPEDSSLQLVETKVEDGVVKHRYAHLLLSKDHFSDKRPVINPDGPWGPPGYLPGD